MTAVIGLGLDSDVPAHLSKRQVTNKAINSFLENVRNKKLSYTRRPAHNVDVEVMNHFSEPMTVCVRVRVCAFGGPSCWPMLCLCAGGTHSSLGALDLVGSSVRRSCHSLTYVMYWCMGGTRPSGLVRLPRT